MPIDLSPDSFTYNATWMVVYLLIPFGILTALFMLKAGPRLLLDWGYAWFMTAFALWVARIVYVVKIDPQPIGESVWSFLAVVNVFLAMLFTMGVLIRSGYYLFRGKEYRRLVPRKD